MISLGIGEGGEGRSQKVLCFEIHSLTVGDLSFPSPMVTFSFLMPLSEASYNILNNMYVKILLLNPLR